MINTIEEAISRLRYIQLDTDFSPADILHMILAAGPSQPIYSVRDGMFFPAVDFLTWTSGDIVGYPVPGRPFFVSGTARFPADRRENQFLGTLSVAQVNFKTTRIRTNRGNEGTLLDMAEAATQVFPRGEDPAWSLMLFSEHPGVTAEWHNERGELQSVERILESAIQLPYGFGACLGTHLLEGIACATARFCMLQDVEPVRLTGVWKEADEYLQGAIELIQSSQKDDGSIDRAWFRRHKIPRTPREWKEKLKDFIARRQNPARAIVYTTGHILDAFSPMSLFFGNEREWIDYACYIVARTVETEWLTLVRDIPSLTHSVHALKLLGRL
jgi:hypothetical protein